MPKLLEKISKAGRMEMANIRDELCAFNGWPFLMWLLAKNWKTPRATSCAQKKMKIGIDISHSGPSDQEIKYRATKMPMAPAAISSTAEDTITSGFWKRLSTSNLYPATLMRLIASGKNLAALRNPLIVAYCPSIELGKNHAINMRSNLSRKLSATPSECFPLVSRKKSWGKPNLIIPEEKYLLKT